jgi:squalene-hopene/tetraprenyl-beta-curcumene cyclase
LTDLLRQAELNRRAETARDLAVQHLIGLQEPGGWWKAELATNVTMDAEDLFLRHFLGILTPELSERTARWVLSQQLPEGCWNTFHGGPGDLSTTVEAYVAMRLAGLDAGDPRLQAAARWIRANGGVERTRVFTRIWLAVMGRWRWDDLPVLPPEIALLPSWAPLNIYDFACWARQTIVALSIVMAHRPARPVPFTLDELDEGGAGACESLSPKRSSLRTAAGRFEALDRALHRYEKAPSWLLPRTVVRRLALQVAERWIVRRQEADGCWGGIQPPLVYSVIALHLQGYALEHPVMQSALTGMDSFVIDDDRGRRVEACQSPVWDTALAVVALSDAGVKPDQPAIVSAARWLVDEEVRVAGDWAVRRPALPPGGWAFEFANDNYPDIDDTAEVVMALRRAAIGPGDDGDDACTRAVTWTLGMQCRSGGWAAFDVDNDSRLCAALPFCDFGEVTDPPSADVTAHVVEMLAGEPMVGRGVIERAVTWLSSQQEEDGSWFGRWGVNHIYGTGAAVPALVAAGVPASDRRIQRAADWLERHQNPDGGWGEDIRSYSDPTWRARGESAPSQTAWALLALIAAGRRDGDASRRGVAHLVESQRCDGTWDEPWFTGTGFPSDFSINYHLYRLVFPLSALGRWLNADPPSGAAA